MSGKSGRRKGKAFYLARGSLLEYSSPRERTDSNRSSIEQTLAGGLTDVLDYEIQRCTRKCAATERDLAPGEAFYSVLTVQGADVVRRDYAATAWQGPPADCLGWWKSEVPDPRSTKVQWAPNDVLLDYFQQLQGNESRRDVAYILTLLLIRRRVFKLDGNSKRPDGQEVLLVFCPKNESEYHVPVVTPDAQRAHQIQLELNDLLFARAEPSSAASDGH